MKIYTITTLAHYLRISTQTAFSLVKSGKIKASNVGTGESRKNYRITEEEVQNFLKGGEENAISTR